jgi:hypothetical protein
VNIIERYVCAYIVEALTGVQGSYPEHVYSVLSQTKAKTEHPLLKQVLQVIQMGDLNLAGETARRLVREIVLDNVIEDEESPAKMFEQMAQPKADTYEGVLQRADGLATMIIFEQGRPKEIVGFLVSSERDALEFIKAKYPGIAIKEA